MRDQWEIYGYDAAGRPSSITYSGLGETLVLDYDLRSRTVRETFNLGATSRTIETQWDLANRRTRVFTRDAMGSEQDLMRPEYQQSRLSAIEYGNGLRRENLYDPVTERFTGYRTTELGSTTVVEDTTITHEAEFGPSRMEVTTRTETSLATTQEQYWLGLGGNLQDPSSKIGARVFRWQAWTWIDDALQDEDGRIYAWDELGNPVDNEDGDVFTYNAERNRLLDATVNGVSHTYTYDHAGFATSRDGLPVAWTAAGRLATMGPAVSPLVRIEWDLAGRPVSVTALGATREFALFGGRLEYDAATGQTGWLHLTHVSLPFVGDERIYRHLDALGNIGVVTDETGAVTSHRRYHPFGLDQVYGAESFDDDDPRGFVGGVELRHEGVATGLVMLGARVLDSDVGRFLSQDPVFQLMNLYSYADGNPLFYEDSDGRHAEPKPAPGAALETAKALDVIAAYFATAATLLGVKAAANALDGNLPAAAKDGVAIAVLLSFAAIAEFSAVVVELFVAVEVPNICPCSEGVAAAPVACASAPSAVRSQKARSFDWVSWQLLALLYLGWVGLRRSRCAVETFRSGRSPDQ